MATFLIKFCVLFVMFVLFKTLNAIFNSDIFDEFIFGYFAGVTYTLFLNHYDKKT